MRFSNRLVVCLAAALKRAAIACAMACLALAISAGAAAAATYTYTGALFTTAFNNSTCVIGTCVTYNGERVTASFTTASPLAANLANAQIGTLITSYTANDGFTPISSADPRARLYQANVSTDAGGQITNADFLIELFATATPDTSATINGRFNYVVIGGGSSDAYNNRRCPSIGAGFGAGTSPNACTGDGGGTDGSRGNAGAAGVWVSVLTTIPTLSQWAMLVLALLLVAIAAATLHRRTFAPA